MGNSAINNLSNPFNYLESALNNALQNVGAQGVTAGSTANTSSTTSTTASDNGELSPLAQILTQLQQLQQSDPTEYAQITGQISTNLQNAAGTAQADGDTSAANQLNQLAQDFSNASSSGQLPNIQDLAQAIGGGHHHHHHAWSSDSDANSTSPTSSNQAVSQLFTPLEPNGGQNNSLNPASIILNTLSGAADGTNQS